MRPIPRSLSLLPLARRSVLFSPSHVFSYPPVRLSSALLSLAPQSPSFSKLNCYAPPRHLHSTSQRNDLNAPSAPPPLHPQKDGDKPTGNTPQGEEKGAERGEAREFTDETEFAAMSMTAKAKYMGVHYGRLFVGTHLTLSAVSIMGWYGAVSTGLDVSPLLVYLPASLHTFEGSDKMGAFAVAYLLHKASQPARIPLSVAATVGLSRLLNKKPPSTPP